MLFHKSSVFPQLWTLGCRVLINYGGEYSTYNSVIVWRIIAYVRATNCWFSLHFDFKLVPVIIKIKKKSHEFFLSKSRVNFMDGVRLFNASRNWLITTFKGIKKRTSRIFSFTRKNSVKQANLFTWENFNHLIDFEKGETTVSSKSLVERNLTKLTFVKNSINCNMDVSLGL